MIAEFASVSMTTLGNLTPRQWIIVLYTVAVFAITALVIWDALKDSGGPLFWGWLVGWIVGSLVLRFLLTLGRMSGQEQDILLLTYHSTFALCFPICVVGLLGWGALRLLNTGLDRLVQRARTQS